MLASVPLPLDLGWAAFEVSHPAFQSGGCATSGELSMEGESPPHLVGQTLHSAGRAGWPVGGA